MNRVDASNGDNFIVSGICRNCTNWSNPPLDLTSTSAPFMWAVGPPSLGNTNRWSNALNAPLRLHQMYSTFTMDMTQATVQTNPSSQLPDITNGTSGASVNPNFSVTQDLKSPAHGIAMVLALIFLIPLEMFLRACIKSAKFQIFMTAIISILFIAGLALGFVVSPWFVRVSFLPTLPRLTLC
jgi:hypothetical protein